MRLRKAGMSPNGGQLGYNANNAVHTWSYAHKAFHVLYIMLTMLLACYPCLLAVHTANAGSRMSDEISRSRPCEQARNRLKPWLRHVALAGAPPPAPTARRLSTACVPISASTWRH